MGTATMGKVVVSAKMENLHDWMDAQAGRITADKVRALEVTDALVDTGATMLGVPKRLIAQLGLQSYRTRQARTAAGMVTLTIYGPVRLAVQGRDCNSGDVMELPDDCPVVIGQLPLEALDFVADPEGRRLIGNPDHGGQDMIDAF